MSAGAGSRAFRDWQVRHRLRGLALGPAPFAVLAVIVVVVACSIRIVIPRYGWIAYGPAFTGHTAQQPGVGYFNLDRLKRRLAAQFDRRVPRGMRVVSGECDRTSPQSASCRFFDSYGLIAEIPVNISPDGSTYSTPASYWP